MKADITTTEDIKLLVDTFYTRIQQDNMLGPVFATRIADGNWQPHLDKMYRFWGTLLLYSQNYSGSPFDKHIGLNINATHFKQWLYLFSNTVDNLFVGDNANTAKERANNIALTFEYKLQNMESDNGLNIIAH